MTDVRALLRPVTCTVVALLLPLAGVATVSGEAATADAPRAGSTASYAAPARAEQADPANPSNPLAGRTWGVYTGLADPAWAPYERASGVEKEQLAKIALRPKAKFFGAWIPNSDIAEKVHEYINSSTAEDPDALVQMTLFRMVPWEQEACNRLPTAVEQASYKDYIDKFATAIGSAHAAVVVQPDGPFARCAPQGSKLPSKLIAYTVRALARQPHTAAYVEMGSADWFRDEIGDAVRLLLAGGIAHARGFALGASHFDSVARSIKFGTRIVASLADKGVPDAHFVIDTSDNGRPFTGEWFHQTHPQTVPVGVAKTCQTREQTHCVTLGIPPTTNVADRRWGLSEKLRGLAARHVDGYLWISRPWLTNQQMPFNGSRALDVVRTTPY